METTGENKRFMIEDRSGQPVGMTGIYGINWIHRTCEFGVFIGVKEEQGKGYGSEAYRIMEGFGGKYLNLRKIKVFVVKENAAAVTMYRKLGFRQAGELQDERFINGRYCSVLILEKLLGGVNSFTYVYIYSPGLVKICCGGRAA